MCWMMTSLFSFSFQFNMERDGIFFIFLKWFMDQIMVSKRNILEWKSSHGVTLNSVAIEKSPFKIKFKLKMSPKGKVSRPFSKPNFRFFCWLGFNLKNRIFFLSKYFLSKMQFIEILLKRIICKDTYNWTIVLYC